MSDEASKHDSQPIATPLKRLLNRLFGNAFAALLAWVLLALGLLLVALRVSMIFVPVLEGQANQWLRERFDAHLFGLQGSWHGITPQLRIESILFRHGSIQDVRLSVDLFGSLLARAPRVDSLSFRHAAFEFPPDFDLADFLLHSQGQANLMSMIADARVLSGNFDLRAQEHSEGLSLNWHMQPGRENQGQIRLLARNNEGSLNSEGIVIGYDLDAGLLHRRFEGAIWAEGRLTIPDSLTPLIGVSGTISSLDAEILIVGGRLSALAEVQAEMLRVGNYLIDTAHIVAKGKGTPWLVQGELERATLERYDQALDLAGALFSYEDNYRWRFNVPDQLIEHLTSFVVASGRDETLLVRWCERFSPTGNLLAITGEKTTGNPLVLSARVEDLSAVSWMGSPELGQLDAQLVFASGRARMLVESASPVVGLPKLFDQPVALGFTSGEFWVRFLPGYFGMRGIDIHAALPGGGEGRFNLSYSGPVDPNERQIAARMEGRGISAVDSLKFLPKLLPEKMKDWLRRGVQGGVIEEGEILMGGYVRRQPPLPTTQVEMWLNWQDGTVAFHTRWPVGQAVSGRMELTGKRIHGKVEYAELLGAPVEDLRFEMPLRGPFVHLSDHGKASSEMLLELMKRTPIADSVPFNLSILDSQGEVDYVLDASLPLAFDPADMEVKLELDFGGVDVELAHAAGIDVPLTANQLEGALIYRFPDEFTSDGIEGFLFGQPVSFSLTTRDSGLARTRSIQAEVNSRIDDGFLSDLVGEQLPITGASDYTAFVEIGRDPERWVAPRIRFHSELLGMEAQIPGGLGKRTDEVVPLSVDLTIDSGGRMGEASFSLEQRAGGVLNWKPSADSKSQSEIRAALVLGADHSALDLVASGEGEETGDSGKAQLRIMGGLSELLLEDLRQFDSSASKFSLPELKFEDFTLDRFHIGQFYLNDISMDGSLGRARIDINFEGEGLEGTWRSEAGAFSQLEFARVHLQSASEQESVVDDLMGDLDLSALPEVDLSADSLMLAENDYGAWKLGLRRIEDGVRLVNIEADARGLSIRAADDLVWRQLPDGTHESRFVGELTTDDLADAMSMWGFAPSVEAERAQLTANLLWPGVPWKPRLEVLSGDMDLIVRRGRFRDFDPGAGMKLLTLLDFNAFMRRLALDFSDVFGEGVAFDEVRVKSQFEDSLMSMIEPAKIDGNGGRFRLSGSINLETQELDTELQATLKISRSLPWLAAYLALLGNPLTGLSVVVVERVLRDRIEDVSTARYYVTGTLSEPVFSLTEVEEPEPLPEALLNPEFSSDESGEGAPSDEIEENL